jgi:hypothetical protein
MSLFGFSTGLGATFVHPNHDRIQVVSLAPRQQSCYKKLIQLCVFYPVCKSRRIPLIFASVPSDTVLT